MCAFVIIIQFHQKREESKMIGYIYKQTDLDLYHLNGNQSVSLRGLDHSALGRFGPSSFVL